MPLGDAADGAVSVAENRATCLPGGVCSRMRLHRIDEAHLQHLVRLVEHQHRELREVQGAAVHVVDDAPGRSHHDVHAAPQGIQLRLIALAAINGQHVKAGEVRGVALKRLRHLQRELAGRHQHQHLGIASVGIDARQRGQGERGRLAGAGLGLAKHVGTREQHRDRRGLNGRGRFVADVLEAAQHGLGERQIAEAREAGGVVRVHCSHGIPPSGAPSADRRACRPRASLAVWPGIATMRVRTTRPTA